MIPVLYPLDRSMVYRAPGEQILHLEPQLQYTELNHVATWNQIQFITCVKILTQTLIENKVVLLGV